MAALEGLALPGDLPPGLYSRKLVGWQVLQRINEILMIDVPDNVVNRENPKEDTMVHVNRSGQYASSIFCKEIEGCGFVQSFSVPATTLPWNCSSRH